MNNLEDKEQAALFQWAAYYPQLRWMHAIPNGKKRNKTIAAQIKREGGKAGVWDIFLPSPQNEHHGLYIEMKASTRKNHLTENQSEFGAYAMSQGYKCVVCYGTEEAINTIKGYMKL